MKNHMSSSNMKKYKMAQNNKNMLIFNINIQGSSFPSSCNSEFPPNNKLIYCQNLSLQMSETYGINIFDTVCI